MFIYIYIYSVLPIMPCGAPSTTEEQESSISRDNSVFRKSSPVAGIETNQRTEPDDLLDQKSP